MAEPAVVDVLAASVLGVALFCAGRLVLGVAWRRPVERDVDLTHLVMGVSMAGMLTGWLSGSWTSVWLVVFAASSCWFAWRTRQELCTRSAQPCDGRPAAGAHVPHLVASVSMLFMVVATRWLGATATGHATGLGAGGMSGTMGMLGAGSPALALGVATLLVLDASLCATRVLRQPAVAVARGSGGSLGSVGAAAPTSCGRPVLPLAPRGTAACTLVMSLAMAYMFVTMHP